VKFTQKKKSEANLIAITVTAAISVPSSLTSRKRSCVTRLILKGPVLIGAKCSEATKAGPSPSVLRAGIKSRLSLRAKRGKLREIFCVRAAADGWGDEVDIEGREDEDAAA
jgi:hypothetical protein